MNSNWSYSPETPNLGQNWRFLEPCDLEIWWMTLKNNRAPILSNIKLYASFHHQMWIQTGVTVQKRLSWFVTSLTLTFDLWPWAFAWTSLWSLVITPENFMMIRWWEHSQKGVMDGETDRRTENTIHRDAWSQLKKILLVWEFTRSLSKTSYCQANRGPSPGCRTYFMTRFVTWYLPYHGEYTVRLHKDQLLHITLYKT